MTFQEMDPDVSGVTVVEGKRELGGGEDEVIWLSFRLLGRWSASAIHQLCEEVR